MRWVHSHCLQTWRLSSYERTGNPRLATHCDICQSRYRITIILPPRIPGLVHRFDAVPEPPLRVFLTYMTVAVVVVALVVGLIPEWNSSSSATTTSKPARAPSVILPEATSRVLLDVFSAYDMDNSQSLSIAELLQLAADTGEQTTAAIIERVVARKVEQQVSNLPAQRHLPTDQLNRDNFLSLYSDFGADVAAQDLARLQSLGKLPPHTPPSAATPTGTDA
jgi:hypothetical protein